MTEHVHQQDIPNWDFQRIVASRWEHLAWMHDHFADSVLSGEELLRRSKRRARGGCGQTRKPRAEIGSPLPIISSNAARAPRSRCED